MIILTFVSLIMNSIVGRDSSSLEKLLVYDDDNDEDEITRMRIMRMLTYCICL